MTIKEIIENIFEGEWVNNEYISLNQKRRDVDATSTIELLKELNYIFIDTKVYELTQNPILKIKLNK
jgi:hypothetical protein